MSNPFSVNGVMAGIASGGAANYRVASPVTINWEGSGDPMLIVGKPLLNSAVITRRAHLRLPMRPGSVHLSDLSA